MEMTATEILYGSFKKRQCYNPNSNTTAWDAHSANNPVVRFMVGGSSNFYGKYEFTIPSDIQGSLKYAVITIPLASTAWAANVRYAILEGADVAPNAFIEKNVAGVYSGYCFYREFDCVNLITKTTETITGTVYAKVDISGLTKGKTYAICFFERSDNRSADGYIAGVDSSYNTAERITIYSGGSNAIHLTVNDTLINGDSYIFINGEYKQGIAYVKTDNGYKIL